jgi:hypothetical protein
MKDKNKTRKDELLSRMDDELARVIAAYESLIIQSRELARSMGYNPDYVIGKVMPKTAGERDSTKRITEWYKANKQEAVDMLLHNEAVREDQRKREALISSLKLTSEQKKLLGL